MTLSSLPIGPTPHGITPPETPSAMPHDAPTVSLLTPNGVGAIAVVQFDGPWDWIIGRTAQRPPLFESAGLQSIADAPLGRILYGRWSSPEPESDPSLANASEQVILIRRSRTRAEIQCHGGLAAPARIIADLIDRGAKEISWSTWHSHDQSALQIELQTALMHCSSVRTAQILWSQAEEQPLRAALEKIADRLQALCQLAAPGIPSSATGEMTGLLTDPSSADSTRSELMTELRTLLATADFGRHLTQPWTVVLTGAPNAGKSSLLNRLLGYQRAIVHDQPGTTRDLVSGRTTWNGWPFLCLDTAGLRPSDDPLEAAGISKAREAASQADLELRVIDHSQPLSIADQEFLEHWSLDGRSPGGVQALIVAHKSDLPAQPDLLLPAKAVFVSSVSNTGIGELWTAIEQSLIPHDLAERNGPLVITDRQQHLLQQLLADLERARDREAMSRIETLLRGTLDTE